MQNQGFSFLKFSGHIDITSDLQKVSDTDIMAFSSEVFHISGQGSGCDYKEFLLLAVKKQNCWRQQDSNCKPILTFSSPSQHILFFSEPFSSSIAYLLFLRFTNVNVFCSDLMPQCSSGYSGDFSVRPYMKSIHGLPKSPM